MRHCGELKTLYVRGVKFIGDQSGQCFALRKLFFEYAGPPENRAVIWEDVLAAIGTPALNEECSAGLPLDEAGLKFIPGMKPETLALLAESGKYYKGLYEYARILKTSLLMLAVWTNDSEMVELFLAHGAKPDVGRRSGPQSQST